MNNRDDPAIGNIKHTTLDGDVVRKPMRPWTRSVHRYLAFLDKNGFRYAPKILGIDGDNNEMIEFMAGEYIHPKPWSDNALIDAAKALRELHRISIDFASLDEDVWQPWFLRGMGGGDRIVSHCDFAPWNVITKGDSIKGIIDWEYAGPADPRMELARACWLFVQLYDEDVQEKVGLPPLEERCAQLRLFVDSYSSENEVRNGLIDRIIEVAAYETAEQAKEMNVKEDSVGSLWGISWRARSVRWMMEHREELFEAL